MRNDAGMQHEREHGPQCVTQPQSHVAVATVTVKRHLHCAGPQPGVGEQRVQMLRLQPHQRFKKPLRKREGVNADNVRRGFSNAKKR